MDNLKDSSFKAPKNPKSGAMPAQTSDDDQCEPGGKNLTRQCDEKREVSSQPGDTKKRRKNKNPNSPSPTSNADIISEEAEAAGLEQSPSNIEHEKSSEVQMEDHKVSLCVAQTLSAPGENAPDSTLPRSNDDIISKVQMKDKNASSGTTQTMGAPAQPSSSPGLSKAARRRKLAARLSGEPEPLQEITNQSSGGASEGGTCPQRIVLSNSVDGKYIRIHNLDTDDIHFECSFCRRAFGNLLCLEIHYRIHLKTETSSDEASTAF